MAVEILTISAQLYEKVTFGKVNINILGYITRMIFPEVWKLESFQTAKVTLVVTQSH